MDLERFRSALAAHSPVDPDVAVERRAATAAVLRFTPTGPEVLLMVRAERQGDLWSGHVAMPGGRHEPQDRDLLATAIRETREEIGVDLSDATVLGRLAAVQAMGLPMTVTTYVFHLAEDQTVVLSEEGTDWFWFPLARAASGELDEEFDFTYQDRGYRLQSWRWGAWRVWGLTHHMLTGLLTLVR